MMKKRAISLLLMLLLTGCNADTEIERGMALRSAILQGNGCRFEAQIHAEYPEAIGVFGMKCDYEPSGEITFSVTEPESISGITGKISGRQGMLTFDETVLTFVPLSDEQISPVSAPWIFMKTLTSGYLTSACMEEEHLRLTIDDSYESDALTVDIWIDAEDCPVRAEAICNGRRILSLDIRNFVIL